MRHKLDGRGRRKLRIRKKVHGSAERPRLTVYRSARHIYAQVVDDVAGRTLVSASTLCKELQGSAAAEPAAVAEAPADQDDKGGKKPSKGKPALRGKMAAAARVGSLLADRCKAAKIDAIVFDRNGYLYHGRVRALAEAARKAGLDF